MKKLVFCLILLLTINQGFSQINFTDLVKRTEKSVVTVSTFDKDSTPLKIGSAFFIDESGILISNLHVFLHATSAKITTWDGKEFNFKTKLSFDEKLDLIKFNISNPTNVHFIKVEMANSTPLKGEDIFVIGAPGGFESSVSKGIVSGIRDVPDVGNYFQITAPISPGSSGSPVFNMQGKVFGIATLQYQEGQNLNFAIDINLVKKLSGKSEDSFAQSQDGALPDDKAEAKRAISIFWGSSEQIIDRINEYIAKFPADYYGYQQRALALWARLDIMEGVSSANRTQKLTECLIESDKDFAKALQLSSNKSSIYFYRGVTKYNLLYRGIIKYNPLEYADPKLIGWNRNGALSDFNKCVGFDGGDYHYDSKFEYIGDIKRDLNDYVGAIAAYKQAILSFPKRFNIYEVYNKCAEIYYYELKDNKNATTYIDKAFSLIYIDNITDKKLLFTNWGMFILRSNLKRDLNELSGALADVNFVLQCRCTEAYNAYNHFLRASLLIDIDGDSNEIIASLSKAIEYTKNEDSKATYYDLRSLEYYQTKQYQLALIDRNKFFELTPPSKLTASNFSARANIKEHMLDYTGALKDLNKAIELDCNVAYYYYLKGGILSRLNGIHPTNPIFHS